MAPNPLLSRAEIDQDVSREETRVKLEVTIKHTQTATIDIGALPVNLIRELLVQNNGTFDGNWSLGDIRSANEKWVVDSIDVVEVAK
jgi:hypothetical protein